MSISILFTPAAGARERYDDTIKRLQDAGQWLPEGMQYHVAFGEGDQFKVLEVWDTREKADKFAETLMPILQDVGIDPGQPQISDTVNIEQR